MENFDIIILRKGDILSVPHFLSADVNNSLVRFLQPSTNHFVVNLKNSITLGGHFYTYDLMNSTLKGIVRDHFIGASNTNTEHPKVLALLMRAVCSFAEYREFLDAKQGMNPES